MTDRFRFNFYTIFVVTLLFKILLSVEVPLTGDEALFIVWAKDLSWGYYDHPPGIGWLLAFMLKISSAIYIVRLPAVLLNHLIVFGIIHLIRIYSKNEGHPYLAGAFYLLLPVSLLNVLVTNDTALTLYSFISTYFFLMASHVYEEAKLNNRKQYLQYVGAGVFLGLAFLSKYLAVILILPFIIVALRSQNWKGIIVTLLASLPFPIINLLWNLENCWQNIQFNLVNRLEDKVTPWSGIGSYLLTLLYILTPWMIYFLWKNRSKFLDKKNLAILTFIPFALFGILSIRQLIGLHWLPALIPPLVVLAGLSISENGLIKIKKWTFYLTGIHAILILILVYAPVTTWKEFKFYEKLALLKHSSEVAQLAYANLPSDTYLMTRGYSTSSIFSYYLNTRVPVFGMGSKFGRHDDLHFDFKNLDGKSIRIFDNSPVNLDDLKPYFKNLKEVPFVYRNITYRYIEAKEFNYEAYRKSVLTKIADRFYQFPEVLPRCKCDFLEKYNLNSNKESR